MKNKNNFYELVLMIRPDVSAKHISDIYQSVESSIQNSEGNVKSSEYWGFRTLAYRVAKRAKAHYVYLAFSTPSLDPIYKYLKFHPDVLRFLCINEEESKVILPSPLFHSTLENLQTSEDFQQKGEQI